MIGIAVAYATILLVGPLIAIAWGAFGQGVKAFASRLTAPDALHAMGLTCLLAVGATVINTVLGVPTALALTRDEFRGRRFLNALVDLPFAISPVITGFLVILLFGRDGWLQPMAPRSESKSCSRCRGCCSRRRSSRCRSSCAR